MSTPIVEKSTLSSPFDSIATTYDDYFEKNPVTQRLRHLLWQKMFEYFQPGMHVLDLNCGTGTDALYLAQNGIHVIAIDTSSEMITIAKRKADRQCLSQSIEFHHLQIEELSMLKLGMFEGIISNFGGLNCVRNIKEVLADLAHHLKPGGLLYACLINKISLWEIVSSALRGKRRSAFRRFHANGIDAPLGSNTIHIWYYNPYQFVRFCSQYFKVKSLYGLNILSPSPNSKRFVVSYPKLTSKLLIADNFIRYNFPFHSLGDHFVVELIRSNR